MESAANTFFEQNVLEGVKYDSIAENSSRLPDISVSFLIALVVILPL